MKDAMDAKDGKNMRDMKLENDTIGGHGAVLSASHEWSALNALVLSKELSRELEEWKEGNESNQYRNQPNEQSEPSASNDRPIWALSSNENVSGLFAECETVVSPLGSLYHDCTCESVAVSFVYGAVYMV